MNKIEKTLTGKFCLDCMVEISECGAPHNWEVAELTRIPNCDFCVADSAAKYDAADQNGIWAYMCQAHFTEKGASLGLGKGQKLVKVGA
tara:strand:+ start:427 stop:693 length:267 start_codon:yes stop_codon:yes gene_type:complete